MKLIIIFLIISSTVFAQYTITKSVLGNGGESLQNSNYKVNATIGQSVIGLVSNSVEQSNNGFWYQVNAVVTAVESESDNLPNEFELYQNYPNPFNPSTTIKYTIPNSTHPLIPSREGKERSDRGVLQDVQLKIYDILGKEVITLVNKKQLPGYYKVTWDAGNLPSGVYIYQLKAGSFVENKKLMLLK